MSRPISSALFALALLAWGLPARAADHGAVSGVVRDTEGSPLRGVEVALVEQWERGDQLNEEVVVTVGTDADGHYALTVPNVTRRYALRLSRDGEVAYETELRPRRNQETLLDFVLPSADEQEVLSPEAVEAFNAAVNASRAGNLRGAVGHFQTAVELAPESAAAHLALAELLLRLGDAQVAAPLADKAVELDSGNPRALEARFRAYDAAGDQEKAAEARDAYEVAVPGAIDERLLEEAQEAYNSGELDVAEQRLIALLERQPDQPRGHYLLGLCRIYQGDAAGARPHLERFLELAPDSQDAVTARDFLHGLETQP
ncbi:MAG: tetratricopeptide repeat protein [Thermoanaerobaculia bacterium]